MKLFAFAYFKLDYSDDPISSMRNSPRLPQVVFQAGLPESGRFETFISDIELSIVIGRAIIFQICRKGNVVYASFECEMYQLRSESEG